MTRKPKVRRERPFDYVPDDDEDWWPLDRPSAVELLQSALLRHEAGLKKASWGAPITDDGTVSVRFPIEVWRVILDCALKGMHKGQGPSRPPLSRGDKVRREAIYADARKRKKELMALRQLLLSINRDLAARNISASDARKRKNELLAKYKITEEGKVTTTEDCEQQAAEEAQELGETRYAIKLSVSTIRRMM
jgi:hypothetical protein